MNLETALKDFQQNATGVDEAVRLLKAMANEHRLLILCNLLNKELSVSELNAIIPIAQSSMSQHLSWLRREGYVKNRRQSKTIYYSINSDVVESLIGVLHQFYCKEPLLEAS